MCIANENVPMSLCPMGLYDEGRLWGRLPEAQAGSAPGLQQPPPTLKGSQHQQEPVGRTSSAAADGELLAGTWPEYSHKSQAQRNILTFHKSKL